MRIDPPNCMTCPQNMFVYLDGCTQCDSTCQTCDQFGCLTCLTNQFIDSFHRCSNCPSHCLTCDINTCYQCANDCSQCDLVSCLICPNNYYISGTNCIKCDDNCSLCDAQGCLACLGPTILFNRTCQCLLPCLTCNANQCLTCMSSEYRLHNHDCLYCPQRCQACDHQGNCLQEVINYTTGISNDNQNIQCTQCYSGYFLSNNICLECQTKCLTCYLQNDNCTICRFPEVSNSECQICESQIGLYSDYINNECYSICGDGLIAPNEHCDDGNLIVGDGCSNCQIEQGFTCSDITCLQIVYPTPRLTQILTYDLIYNDTKSFLLHYNVPIIVQKFKINVSITNFKDFSFKFSQINSQSFHIDVQLFEESLNCQLLVQFYDYDQILSQKGVAQVVSNTTGTITNFILISPTEQSISDSATSITEYLLILLLILVAISILCGGLEIFWNLLDLLQMISYLKYINTDKPFVLVEYFKLFGFLQFQNLPINFALYIPIEIQRYLNTTQRDPPLLMYDDGYTCSPLMNFIPILNVLLTGILLYYIARITLYFLIDQKVQVEVSKTKSINNLKIWFFDFEFYIYKCCLNITRQWKWNGIIRLFFSCIYEICLMISLGIYSQSEALTIDLYFTLIFMTIFLCVTYIISLLTGYLMFKQQILENKLSAIYEGFRFNGLAKYCNTMLIYKKTLFMMSLILLYNEPLFQILCIIKFQSFIFIGLINLNPIDNRYEKIKQLICESFMLITQIQLAILVIDDYFALFAYNYRKVCGYICIFAITTIIITQIVIDSLQQYQMYYKKYKLFRKVVDWIRKGNQNHVNQEERNRIQYRNFII